MQTSFTENQLKDNISKDSTENLTDVQSNNHSDTPIKDFIDSAKSFIADDPVEATKDVDIRFLNENGVNKPQAENNHFFMCHKPIQLLNFTSDNLPINVIFCITNLYF